MPSMSAHMAIACRLCNLFDVNKEEFIKGNLLPDLYDDKEKSHFKIKGKLFMVPNINEAINNLNINNSMDLGYLSHLLLDKYYFDEYLIKYDSTIFNNNNLYYDYDVLNIEIIKYFNLDINYLKQILKEFPKDINNEKLLKNIECLDLNISGNTKIIDKEEFLCFLENVSKRIIDNLRNLNKKNNL